MKRIALLLAALALFATGSYAETPYRNPEFHFSIVLHEGQRVCGGNLEGVSIALRGEQCRETKDYSPLALWVEYNSLLLSGFPTSYMRNDCARSPLVRSSLVLDRRPWFTCRRADDDTVRILYYNYVPADQKLKWRYFGIEIKMNSASYERHKDEIQMLIEGINLTDKE